MPKKTATWPEAGAGYLAADPEMYSLIHAVTTHEIVLPCLAATGFASPPGQNTLSRSNLNQGSISERACKKSESDIVWPDRRAGC